VIKNQVYVHSCGILKTETWYKLSKNFSYNIIIFNNEYVVAVSAEKSSAKQIPQKNPSSNL